MQKILRFFSLDIAKAVPTVMAAGRAGGTVIVIRSRDLSTMSAVSRPSPIIIGRVQRNPIIAISPILKMNFSESW